MSDIKKIINSYITCFREKQGKSKKLLRTERFENDVIMTVGCARKYNELGGYKKFYESIIQLKGEGTLKDLANPRLNGKKPSLHEAYWIVPKYVENTWDKAAMAKVMNYLDLSFYLRKKIYQTEDEWKNILILYEFIKSKDSHK
ncbi:hypothetical protein [Bacillus cereus]